MFFKKYPCKCDSYKDYYYGEAYFSCLYETDETYGENDDCTECVASWATYGGRRSPKKWIKKWPWIICFLLWGPPGIDFDDCRSCKNRVKNDFCVKNNGKIKEYEWRCQYYKYKKPNFIWYCWKLFCWTITDCIQKRKQREIYRKWCVKPVKKS